MNPMNRQVFFLRFRKTLRSSLSAERAEKIWKEAGIEYERILASRPEVKKHKGAMVLPVVALYRALKAEGEDAEELLNSYGEALGKRFGRAVHALTSLPGVDRFLWKRVGGVMDRMSSEKHGYRRRIVSEPPKMYGVDILSCPYHELAKELGDEKAVLCICRLDKKYAKGFHHIRYDRNSAVSEGARACEYRLRFDLDKE